MRKLTLSTETLRVLDDDDLIRVVGGGPNGGNQSGSNDPCPGGQSGSNDPCPGRQSGSNDPCPAKSVSC